MQAIKRVLMAAATVPVLWYGSHTAAFADNVSDGRAIADRWCSSCHDVGASGTRSAKDLAPSFESVARRDNLSRVQLETWIGNPHPPMPNLNLTRREVDNLVEYIQSLKSLP